jgi:hypothetical protein
MRSRFFHSLKAAAIHGVSFKTDAQLRACLRWYVPFYIHRRSHSSIATCPQLSTSDDARKTGGCLRNREKIPSGAGKMDAARS